MHLKKLWELLYFRSGVWKRRKKKIGQSPKTSFSINLIYKALSPGRKRALLPECSRTNISSSVNRLDITAAPDEWVYSISWDTLLERSALQRFWRIFAKFFSISFDVTEHPEIRSNMFSVYSKREKYLKPESFFYFSSRM